MASKESINQCAESRNFEGRAMSLTPIAFVQFTDGPRPVYEESGRQFTHDNVGKRGYGV
jgi:hypothetical protein